MTRWDRVDTIELTGIRAVACHGVLPHERTQAQPFVVDVRLSVDLARAAASDELPDTIDYGALSQRVVDIVTGTSFQLIEALAGRILDVCLEDARVQDATVTVHKPHAPVDVPVGDVAVTLFRPRS